MRRTTSCDGRWMRQIAPNRHKIILWQKTMSHNQVKNASVGQTVHHHFYFFLKSCFMLLINVHCLTFLSSLLFTINDCHFFHKKHKLLCKDKQNNNKHVKHLNKKTKNFANRFAQVGHTVFLMLQHVKNVKQKYM